MPAKIVESEDSAFGPGSSGKKNLQQSYPGSPIHSGEIDDDSVTAQFEELVIEGEVNDGGRWYGTFNRDYEDAPNLEEVETGGGGLPGSPYAPNIASPPEGQNPTDIPESGVEATQNAQGSGGAFDGDGLASPHESSKRIAKQTIGSLMKGSSNPGS